MYAFSKSIEVGPFEVTAARLERGGWFLARLVWNGNLITERGAENHAAGWEVNLNGVRYTPHAPEVKAEAMEILEADGGVDLALPHALPGDVSFKQIVCVRPSFITMHCEVSNGSDDSVIVERFNFAQVKLDPRFKDGLELYRDYGAHRAPVLECHLELDDPGVVFAKAAEGWGIAMLNLAPGVTRRIATGNYTSIGYANSSAPFRWTLAPGEQFSSDAAAVIPWQGNAQSAVYRFVHDELRGGRAVPQPVSYCSWEPFCRDINEARIFEQADHAANLGFEVFIVDDGWQDYAGDWRADPGRFPRGLEAVRDHVEGHGMRLGLWIALTTVHSQSKASAHAPLLLNAQGEPYTTAVFEGELSMACLVSDYRKHIYQRLRELVSGLNLRYLKVDLPVVQDVYFRPALQCFAENHDHPPGADYTLRALRVVQQIARDLRGEFPELIVDLTFELWGGWHMIDHALAACADACWLSNLSDAEGSGAYGPAEARHLAASRASLIPPAHQVVGNLRCNGPYPAESVASAFASFPMLLGDLAALDEATAATLHDLIEWFKARDAQGADAQCLQVLEPGCESPSPHRWSGFLRLDSFGKGIMGIFRNRSPKATVELVIKGANAEDRWQRSRFQSGEQAIIKAGESWQEHLDEPHGFALYRIEPAD